MKTLTSRLLGLSFLVAGVAGAFSACAGGGSSAGGSSSSSGGANTSSSSSSGQASSSSSTGGTGSSSSTGGTGSSSSGSTASSHSTTGGFSMGASGGFNLSGMSFGNIDAGIVPYTGERETGVKCSSAVCGADGGAEVCCAPISFTGTPAPGTCGTTCTLGQVTASCDGPEDCSTAGNVCCFRATFSVQAAACTTEADCVNSGATTDLTARLCNRNADCPNGWGCCQSLTLKNYLGALDYGACKQGACL